MGAMTLYQRTLFIGVGGTGLAIGSRLEQTLRTELCGPDGTALQQLQFPSLKRPEPFQLPSCVQFVYFDFDESARTEAEAASCALASPKVSRETAYFAANLVPQQNSSQAVAETLRIAAPAAVAGWLPDVVVNGEREPEKSPLTVGAGTLPTVGRAALFETLRAEGGLEPLERPLRVALAKLASSEGDLKALAGEAALGGVAVFIGFSIAGGTGCGTFQDVLRVVADIAETQDAQTSLNIYPLVVLPSAFHDKYPDKRRAHMLNGGPALRELFELVDNANRGLESEAVTYPGSVARTIARTIPARTTFLFHRPDSVGLDDLHRSIVSFVVSLSATTVAGEGAQAVRPLAADLIDLTAGVSADDGIGCHPAATAIAAELRIPFEEIAEIVSSRLLAQAVQKLREPGPNERNDQTLFDPFAAATKLSPLVSREAGHALPSEAERRGAKSITAYLIQRRSAAHRQTSAFPDPLRARLAPLAAEFNYEAGIEALLAREDVFRTRRAILGHPRLEGEENQLGIVGFIRRRGDEAPSNPRGFGEQPPEPPPLRNRFGLVPLGLNNKVVTAAVVEQNEWYSWRIRQEYYGVWSGLSESWKPRLRKLRARVDELVAPFESHADAEGSKFVQRCQALYSKHVGVRYFLPDAGPDNDLSAWYEHTVLPRLREELHLPETADAAAILLRLMHGKWVDGYERARTGPARGMFEYVLSQVRLAVSRILATNHGHPIMPPVQTLLRESAYTAAGAPVEGNGGNGRPVLPAGMSNVFTNSLADLLPSDYRPLGAGPLRVEVFYPSEERDATIEDYLAHAVLSQGIIEQPTFHNLPNVDFVSVVLSRISQPAMAVGEYRRLMSVRADALANRQASDLLPWRQRLGYDPTWIILREQERPVILFRFLNALHDGSIEVVQGTPEQPLKLLLRQLDSPGASPLELKLRARARDELSNWADLLCAYERYILDGGPIEVSRCEQLMARTAIAPGEPDMLYRVFVSLIERQQQAAAASPRHALEREFWGPILASAQAIELPDGRTHDEIAAEVVIGTPVA